MTELRHDAERRPTVPEAADPGVAEPLRQGGGLWLDARPVSKRFHALDGARAAAMLFGVFYHLPIAMMGGGGFGFGGGFGASPKTSIDNWLHSYRMPLFFMISGIFAAMMVGKYGLGRYLVRRWWRIGAPLFVALLAFAGLRIAQAKLAWLAPPGMGPMAMPFMIPGAGFGGGPGANGTGQAPPFVMPTGGFPTPAPGPAAGRAGGFPTRGFPTAAQGPFVMPNLQLPAMPSHAMAERLFGRFASSFNLEHLWFLWYLLIFVTLGPLVALACGQFCGRVAPGFWRRIGGGLYRMHLVPLAVGLVSLPALLYAPGFMGWSLANPVGFSASFPDFLFQFGHADLPLYFIWFMTGWWLYRFNADFARLARAWRWNLLIGIAAFAASQSLSARFGALTDTPRGEWIRLGGFALYGIGSACTAFGLLGFFERFFNRPSRAGRYFTDAMLWVYLVHLPLIPYLLPWIEPTRSAWWEGTLAGMLLVTGISLILYELLVRTTPLVHIFGPPQAARRPEASGATQPVRAGAATASA